MEQKMTSATSARLSPERRSGFTLIELLVVIGVLVLLAGILIPTITGARRSAQRSRTAAELQSIAVALEAYKSDFGDYPRFIYISDPTLANSANRPNPPTGAQILCQALIAPAPAFEWPLPSGVRPIQDGAAGSGFRIRATPDPSGNLLSGGKVCGPYLDPDKFRIGDPDPTTAIAGMDASLRLVILDSYGNPILYFPAAPTRPNINGWADPPANAVPGFASDRGSLLSLYDAIANISSDPTIVPPRGAVVDRDTVRTHAFYRVSETTNTNALRRFRAMLGDIGNGTANSSPDGIINPGETPASTGPYILWSAGPDGLFGPDYDTSALGPKPQDVTNCDDVTNFR